jgi:hypothetical protein
MKKLVLLAVLIMSSLSLVSIAEAQKATCPTSSYGYTVWCHSDGESYYNYSTHSWCTVTLHQFMYKCYSLNGVNLAYLEYANCNTYPSSIYTPCAD